eukprot:g10580.t1
MCEALMTVNDNRGCLRELFNIAHRFGTALNSNCLAPQAPQGFSIVSLERLAQTKSTASPKHNMLHFVLAMMKPEMSFFALREICETGKYQSNTGEKVKIERRRMTKAPRDKEDKK